MIVRYMAYLCAPNQNILNQFCLNAGSRSLAVKTALRCRMFIPYLDFSIPDPDSQHCV